MPGEYNFRYKITPLAKTASRLKYPCSVQQQNSCWKPTYFLPFIFSAKNSHMWEIEQILKCGRWKKFPTQVPCIADISHYRHYRQWCTFSSRRTFFLRERERDCFQQSLFRDYKHCTMVKLRKGVKSGQLWQIIPPTIFNENLPNFESWCINIKKK